jgi:4-hydroxybenzoate polyprenyltransferase
MSDQLDHRAQFHFDDEDNHHPARRRRPISADVSVRSGFNFGCGVILAILFAVVVLPFALALLFGLGGAIGGAIHNQTKRTPAASANDR